ncbi:Hydroxyisourate hydrolase [Pleomassaria siparia CBS 279.74]|uniref:5-hydroxyisourate hydrolase n=1 Tax=Pleomassaria siparia CBS 279.74 TaxID=1314801 RepID=A0A6G1JX26_9PLEO|nr:Hydroxyisourate hydrolase [Pleomassaria siparia CBS 279.74]
MATSSTKPPITCHVLDTTLGRPAPSIPVTLTLFNPPSTLSPQSLTFRGTTNSDGRVTCWSPTSPFSADSLDVIFKREGDQKWSLTFDTEEYFGGRGVKTFFPEVVVSFLVREEGYKDEGGGKKEDYHVPVLLGPFGYTTYRGS